MVKQEQLLTTGAFASRAGIPTSSVTKLIREGKIKAEKKSGKWMIAPDQLMARALKDSARPGKKAAKPARPKAAPPKPAGAAKGKSAKAKPIAGKTYSVAEFAALTYLTEFGVQQWLKQGFCCPLMSAFITIITFRGNLRMRSGGTDFCSQRTGTGRQLLMILILVSLGFSIIS